MSVRRALLLLGVTTTLSVGPSTAAWARYAAVGGGGTTDVAATVPTPPAPTIGGTTSALGQACLVQLSWTAPPAGEEYTITRTVGTTKTVVKSAQTGAGSTTDTVLLSGLGGNAPVYTVSADWITDVAWTAGPGPGATAAGCLSLI